MGKYVSYVLYLLISILVVILYINDFGPLNSMQRWVDDTLCSLSSEEGTRPNVALVTIDGPAMDRFGYWPWNNDLIADLLAAIAHGEPKTIVLNMELSEDAAQDSAGYTSILAEQMEWIEKVVLPYDIALTTFRSSKIRNPEHLFNFSVAVDNKLGLMNEKSSLKVRKVFLPADKLLQTDPYLGFEYTMPDNDRTLRHQALVMNYEGYYYPSVALMAATSYLDIPASDITVIEGKEIRIGNQRTIPVNDNSELFLSYSRDLRFNQYSAAEVLGENFDFSRLNNKLVLIAVDDHAYTELYQTPVNPETPKYLIKATAIENIINDNLLSHVGDMSGLTLLILFVLGGICAFVLPQVSLLYRMIILSCGLFLLINVNYFLVSSFRLIAETIYIAAELLLFMVASPLLDSSFLTGSAETAGSETRKKKLPKVEIDKALKSDKTPIAVREIRESSNDPANLPTATIDREDKQSHDYQAIDLAEAETVATSHADDHVEEETTTVTSDADSHIVSAGDSAQDLDDFIDSAEIDIDPDDGWDALSATPVPESVKKLGRYQISGTLGKGAMGHVYKGIDPAINRPVALKTIRLDFINDLAEMAELKERLHREAQAAGKLSHSNIVTIYDIGSEGSLQYIAMEYLEGRTLEDIIKKKVKLNYKILSQVIIQICNALQYAHDQNIVHRDIKPANIMILKDYRVKVMDFGIARIDSNSMTKTGIAMGTPNYISPEQLQGKSVDRRADLFSLGVVMYELLIGKRPFRGENITSLIYSILHHEPEKPSNVIPQIPLLFDHIVEKALMKNTQDRYQTAKEIVTDLSEFVEAFAVRK